MVMQLTGSIGRSFSFFYSNCFTGVENYLVGAGLQVILGSQGHINDVCSNLASNA